MTAPPNEKDPLGGDYWRQMVFYKLILENYEERTWKVGLGLFDFCLSGCQLNFASSTRPPVAVVNTSISLART